MGIRIARTARTSRTATTAHSSRTALHARTAYTLAPHALPARHATHALHARHALHGQQIPQALHIPHALHATHGQHTPQVLHAPHTMVLILKRFYVSYRLVNNGSVDFGSIKSLKFTINQPIPINDTIVFSFLIFLVSQKRETKNEVNFIQN